MKRRLSSFSAALTLLTLIAWSPLQGKAQAASVLPLQIDEIIVRDGGLVALGSLDGLPFETPLTLSGACPVLNLSLGPIHLDVLGLVVDTSPICLDLTADPGGGLLGDLLCGVGGLLGPLDPLNLTPQQLTRIRDVLNVILNLITAEENVVTSGNPGHGGTPPGHGGTPPGHGGTPPGHGGTPPGHGGGNGDAEVCPILSLVLGPVDLNLLGLMVHLDDCDGGPVTVDVTAERGPGNLLGNLLCGLAGILDPADILGLISIP
jgi:hypothetical protein